MALAVVHDLREARAPAGPDELAAFETDVLAGLVLARAAAGLADSTIAGEVIHLEQVRAWLGRPLWTMEPADADAYFGQVLRDAAKGTRLARSQALKTYFLFLEILCTLSSRACRRGPELAGELMVTLWRARLACRGRWARCGPAAGSGPVSGGGRRG